MHPKRDVIVASLAATLLCVASARADEALEAKLLEVTPRGVKLNLGGKKGVQVGHIFDLYQEAEVYVLPLTRGEVPLVKPQQRVAQVQVYEVEPSTSFARVLQRQDSIALDPKRLIGIHNPTAVAPNREPAFVRALGSMAGHWGETVRLEFEVSNEERDKTVYTWSVSGGRLRYERTSLPLNYWTPPIEAGEFSLQVSVRDSANNEASRQVSVRSKGPQGSGELKQFSAGHRYSSASRYGGTVSDLSFEWRNTPFVLRPKEGWGGVARVLVDNPTWHERARLIDQSVKQRDLSSLAVLGLKTTATGEDYGAVFGIDRDEKVVVRYDLNAGWAPYGRPPLVIGVPDGGQGNGRFVQPIDLALSQTEDLYVLDGKQRCVQVFRVTRDKGGAAASSFLVSFGRPGEGEFGLQEPVAMALGRDDVVCVLDNGRKSVVIYRGWRPVSEINVGGPEEVLAGIAVDPFSDEIYVLSRSKARVRRYSQQGQLTGEFGGPVDGVPAALQSPQRVRVSPTREVWVIDANGSSVVRYEGETGRFVGRTGGLELGSSLRIAGAPDGGFVALDKARYQVTRFDRDGWVTARFGREGTKSGEFEAPVDLAVGRTNEVYVLDAEQQRVHRFMPRGGVRDGLTKGLEGCVDLSSVNDRSHLVGTQQRERDNFAVMNLEPGITRSFGRDYTGDLTPRFGCMTGVTGGFGRSGRESEMPWIWSVDEDKEIVYRALAGKAPKAIEFKFDEISDIEAAPNGQVFVVDAGDEQLVILSDKGQPTVFKSSALDEPYDLGIDDFGHVFVFDSGHRAIIELVPAR